MMQAIRKPAQPVIFPYIRWSSDQQETGDSLQRQVDAITTYATKEGWTLPKFIKDEGLSAWQPEPVAENVLRGKLGKLLKDAEAGKLPKGAILIAERQDRFCRRFLAWQEMLQTFMKAGIEVRTILDGMIYNTKTFGLQQYMMSGVASFLSQEESDKKSDACGKAWRRKHDNAANKPVTAVCPAWLKLKGNEFQPIPERAKVVRHIFEQNAAGIGALKIAKDLNKRKVPTFSNAKGWYDSYVGAILNNTATIGEGYGQPDYFPAVIDSELFYKAKNARATRGNNGGGSKGENKSNLFSAVARCAYCGSAMRYRNKGTRSYLQCNKARRGLGCEKTVWNYKDFEKTFVDYVRAIPSEKLDNAEATKATELHNQREAVKGRIVEHGEKLEALVDALDKVNSPTIIAKIAAREKAKTDDMALLEKVEREIASLAKATDGKDLQASSVHPLLVNYEKRAHYAQLVENVVDKVIIAPAGSAPCKNIKSWYLVGDKPEEGKRNPKIDMKNHPGMQLPWFAIFLRDVQETQLYAAPGTVIVSTKD